MLPLTRNLGDRVYMSRLRLHTRVIGILDAMQAVVTGTAVSGVAVSLLRVITKASLPDTAEGLRKSAGMSLSYSALYTLQYWSSDCCFC